MSDQVAHIVAKERPPKVHCGKGGQSKRASKHVQMERDTNEIGFLAVVLISEVFRIVRGRKG